MIPQIQIFPGDTVTVPRAGIVYVLGDVNRPGGFALEGRNTLSVEKAMALCQGTARCPRNSKHVHLMRTLEGGRKEDIILSVDLIFKGKAPDVALKDGDILYVPTNTGMVVTEQAISSAISVGTDYIIYHFAY